jgi:hypothetical protein
VFQQAVGAPAWWKKIHPLADQFFLLMLDVFQAKIF